MTRSCAWSRSPSAGSSPRPTCWALQNGFLEDALPVLEALDGMLDDAELAYSHGLCLVELGRPAGRSPRCSGRSNSTHARERAHRARGSVRAHRRADEAANALRDAVKLEPENAFAKRNLAAVLMRSGRAGEALPFFRQAASLAPPIRGRGSGSRSAWRRSGRRT